MKYTLLTLSTLIFIACTPKSPEPISIQEENLSLENNTSALIEAQLEKKQKLEKIQKDKAKKFLPPPPKKKIKLKKVKDNNFDAKYMYPEDKKEKKKENSKDIKNTIISKMTKEKCISMISQEKFDKYTAIFGNEEASIKRCAILQAMKK